MKYLIYILIGAAVYFLVFMEINKHKALSYLRDIKIPESILRKMNYKELIAASNYLQRYVKTNIHFSIDDKDYNILSEIRSKYGIFS